MSRLMRVLLLFLILLVSLGPPLASAADPIVPIRPASATAYSGTVPLYDDERFPPYAYTFEGSDQFNSIGHVPIYFLMNQLLVTKAWLLKTSLRVIEYAMEVDLLAPFLDRITLVLVLFGESFWNGHSPWATGAVSLAGLWAMVLYLGGRLRRVWALLGGTLLILAIASLLLTEGPGWLKTANGLSRAVSTEAFAGLGRVMPAQSNTWGLVGRSGDALWRTLVYEPWLAGEFGSPAGEAAYGQLNGASFLTMTLDQREAVCAPQSRVQPNCPWWGDDFLPRRMLIAGWTFTATLVVSGTLLVLAGGIMFAQLTLLLLLALCPVWLLVALWWPEQGQRILVGLGMRALGALMVQTVLAVTLGLLLLLSLTVSSAFAGWMLRSVILCVLALAAFRYRTAWLEPLAAARLHGEEWLARRAREVASRPETRRPRNAGGQATAAAAEVPVFASVAPGFQRADHLAGGLGLMAEGEPELASQTTTQPGGRSDSFRYEMQVLRERMAEGEPGQGGRAFGRRLPGESPPGQVIGTASAAGPGSGATPAPPAALGESAARRVAAASQRGSDVAKLPPQRPRK